MARSSIEYGSAFYFDFIQTAMHTFEIIYYAILSTSSDLSTCTPIPVFQHEAISSTVHSRLELMSKSFLLRLHALPSRLVSSDPRFARQSNTLGSKWTRLWNSTSDWYHFESAHIIRFTASLYHHREPPFQDLSHQDRVQVFECYLLRKVRHSRSFVLSDALKDRVKISVAAVDVNSDQPLTTLIPHIKRRAKGGAKGVVVPD